MKSFLHRARARLVRAAFVVGAIAGASSASAEEPALSLEDSARLALEHQPLLEAQAAAVASARASAVASAQLADPRLTLGIQDLPIDTAERYSLRRDSDTQLMVGVVQEFPAGDTRQLRGQRGEREAEMAEQQLTTTRLTIRREAALAWVEAWKPEREAALTRDAVGAAELQLQALRIGYTAGHASQAEVLASGVNLGVLRDDLAKLEQDGQHGRSMLSRWIGQAAYGPLDPRLPDWGAPAPVDQIIGGLRAHPHLNADAKMVEIAQADVAIARQAFKPAWWVELGYAHRLAFSDMATVRVGMDLPVFTRNRQDQGLSGKLAEQRHAESLRDDSLREHEAEVRLNSADWALLKERLKRYDEEILPLGEQRTAAAIAAWRAGQGSLAAVLEARRMALENQIKRVDLQADAQKHRIKLQYLAGEGS